MNSQQITGSTRLIALLGHPVAHSVSPQIHNHAFAAMGLPFAYVALDTPPGSLSTVVQTMRVCSFAGANVTIPHKQAILELCDHISQESQLIGAVNTLYFDKDGALNGTTTDPAGFLRALSAVNHDPAGGSVVILGNGGTARTLAAALAYRKIPTTLTLAGRDLDKVQALANHIVEKTGVFVAATRLGEAACNEAIANATLLVNCTSVGMHPLTQNSPVDPQVLHPGLTVFDTIYNPLETRLLAQARAAGCACSNGLNMLLFQALESFRYWTAAQVSDTLFDMKELQQQVGRPAGS